MNLLTSITIFGKEIPGWTIEIALFWLLCAIVVITIIMVITFAVLIRRVGRNETVVVPNEEEPKVNYNITVIAPENLTKLQVVLFNGQNQVGQAVNVVDGKAIIEAPAGDYLVKVFGLPEGNYEVDAELLSEEKLSTNVVITYIEEEEAPVNEVIEEPLPEEKTVSYEISVEAPENLNSLQVALFNGQNQVGQAVNVVDGKAIIEAPAGDYLVKVFGLPDGNYEVEAELLSEEKLSTNVVITRIEEEKEQVNETIEEPASEEPAPQQEVSIAATIEVKSEPLVVEEESVEGGVLGYDKSFTAKLIQSDDDTKHWYTELKNELLSYKKIKDRMSWKRESYRFGRLAAARLAIRGKTLCLFLPLNPNDYLDSKYKVEAVEDSTTYDDTPCMYRIKNERRVKYAMELIAVVMEKFETVRIERETVDYYLPYEGVVQLINKGLVKRIIKDKNTFLNNPSSEINAKATEENN